jgi:hypothetical protein
MGDIVLVEDIFVVGQGFNGAGQRGRGGLPIRNDAKGEFRAVCRRTVILIKGFVAPDIYHIGGRVVVVWPGATEEVAWKEPGAERLGEDSGVAEPPTENAFPKFPCGVVWTRLIEVLPGGVAAGGLVISVTESFINADAVGLT